MNQMGRLCGVVLFASACLSSGDPIAIWNFNSNPADSSTATGTNVPSFGAGSLQALANVAMGYVTGTGADPATTDDSALSTQNYPAQGALNNKTGGIQVNASTVGFSNIVVRWDQGASGTASRYYRLQFSVDGYTYTDVAPPIVITSSSGFKGFTNAFAADSGADDNPQFRIRIVSEWESTAIGTRFDEYMPVNTNSSYGPSGSVKFDYLVVSGIPIFDGNYAPTISGIADQAVRVGMSTSPISFTVLDAETAASNLVVTATSSNPGAVPIENIVFGGSSQFRTVTITGGQAAGTSTVTVKVTDGSGKSTSTSFTVTVLPPNSAPVISPISSTNTLAGAAVGPIAFTIGDSETPASNLSVSGVSSNTALVLAANMVFGGSGSNRTVTITPNAGQSGVAPIAVLVSDGTNTSWTSFALMVAPNASVLLYDPFSYGSGSVVTNSGGFWASRSGTSGDCLALGNELQVSAARSEDIIAPLAGAPYATNLGHVLYSSFSARFVDLPNSTPDYFAHLGTASSIRARLYAFIPVGADFGNFRLAIGNATNSAEWPVNLHTNISYKVVTRYDVDNASTTLWLNPSSEADPSVTAPDVAKAVNISNYGFRQSSGYDSTIFIDDLRVGLSFAAAMGSTDALPPPPGIPLNAQRIGPNLVLTWTNPAYALQTAVSAVGQFTNVPSASSPFMTGLSGPARFFRLKGN